MRPSIFFCVPSDASRADERVVGSVVTDARLWRTRNRRNGQFVWPIKQANMAIDNYRRSVTNIRTVSYEEGRGGIDPTAVIGR